MKILVFSLSYFPHVGGAEIAISEITKRLPETEFHMITQRFAGEALEERIGNVVVHRVGSGSSYREKILFIPRAARAAVALQSHHRFDLWWAMMSYMLFPIVLARLQGVQVPYVLSLQEGDPFSRVFNRWRIMLVRPLLTYGFRHAAVVQTISSFLVDWARQAGYPRAPEVIPNGVDLSAFGQTHTHARTGEETVLVTTSRLVHKNALDDVIRALVLLPKSVRFRIYGTGRDEVMLRTLARDLGVSERVEFKGYIAHRDMPHAFEACDIFIRPSRSEGMGNSFVEAMAAGLPVIATQVGGIADFLFDAKRNPQVESTGWAVSVEAPDEIANAVKDILTNPGKVDRITRTARQLVTTSYNWDTVAERMGDLFERAARPGTIPA